MIGWILAGLAAATVYTAVKENEESNNNNSNTTTNLQSQHSNTVSWTVKAVSMTEYPPSMEVEPYLSSNFYIGSYLCPSCNNNMYKTVFRIGGEEQISVNGSKHMLKRLFTCPYCLSFYAPREGQRLSAGSVYYLKCDYSEEYVPILSHYDNVGTTQGRPDA